MRRNYSGCAAGVLALSNPHERRPSNPTDRRDGRLRRCGQLSANHTTFLRAVLPTAEKAGVKSGLHPDDPPLSPQVMEYDAIDRAESATKP